MAVVMRAFNVVILGEMTFDDTGVAAVAAFWVESFGDFVECLGSRRRDMFRGKSPLGR